ncbi:flagellar hook protein FlgE [Methylotuvimicrobium buryatense]|uniref:Flagellar hook protein FlgE n=1 Tax=Methylotuvimicrobium buryatense TaxID=95641 RepID=A0A4P9UQK7_METBY|nr:flagellar hook protein FlgE [Methylotuvimicrobium buryatense]QCW83722.1 flagellar hook protein FlgE [Methylotuvimicrobium buryatense]
MSFATGLSGLRAASSDLQTTGNNIANANTTGFKKSRAEFADVYATSLGGVAKTQPGAGVKVTEVAQQFTQGNIDFTENSLDIAISGNGFFTLANNVNDPQPTNFTRNGAFQLNKEGFVVDDRGRYLMAFKPNGETIEEGFSQGVFQALQVDTSQGLPRATESVDMKINLNAGDLAPTSVFDPSNPDSFNNVTSATIYDSQGNSHTLSTYYRKTGANQWDSYVYLNDRGVTLGANPVYDANDAIVTPAGNATFEPAGTTPAPVPVTFSASGLLLNVNGQAPLSTGSFPSNIFLNGINLAPEFVVEDLNFELDFAGGTQFNSAFSVNDLRQDGLPSGNLTGIEISSEGVMFARFSNGASKPIGQIALARFPNDQGLAKLGDTSWGESADSGQPIFGSAGSNNFGVMQSAALESSNVDLSEQLVRLIIAQQAYQANAQTISTQNTITQTILNIR